jgi:hypothetical protein
MCSFHVHTQIAAPSERYRCNLIHRFQSERKEGGRCTTVIKEKKEAKNEDRKKMALQYT